MAKILLTRRFPKIGIDVLVNRHNLAVTGDSNLSYEQLYNIIDQYDGIISMLSNKLDEKMLAKAKKLKIISNYAVGYDNIDLAYCKKHNITATNTPGVLTAATADLTWALILSTARRVIEGDKFVRQGKFEGWEPLLLLGKEVNGSNIGIIGFGRIGQAVAERAKGFSMNIFYYQRKPNLEAEKLYGAKFLPLDELLSTSDFISLNTPLNSQSYHLLNKVSIQKIKKGAIVINTGRGAVIDELELSKALAKGQLSAGLDVYEYEPKVQKELINMDNVVLLPHLGSSTVETRNNMAKISAEAIIDYFDGKTPKYTIS